MECSKHYYSKAGLETAFLQLLVPSVTWKVRALTDPKRYEIWGECLLSGVGAYQAIEQSLAFWEKEGCFDAFDHYLPDQGVDGFISIRIHHLNIKKSLAVVAHCLDQPSPQSFVQALDYLHDILPSHSRHPDHLFKKDEKNEGYLHLMCDGSEEVQLCGHYTKEDLAILSTAKQVLDGTILPSYAQLYTQDTSIMSISPSIRNVH